LALHFIRSGFWLFYVVSPGWLTHDVRHRGHIVVVFAAKSIAADHFGVSFDFPTPRTYCRQRGRVADLSAHMAAPPIHSHFHHIHIFGIWNGLKHMFPFTMAISLQSVVFISMTIGAFIVVSILKVSPVFASCCRHTA
jgi:hypothetical protein